jgi:hypothetical protein
LRSLEADIELFRFHEEGRAEDSGAFVLVANGDTLLDAATMASQPGVIAVGLFCGIRGTILEESTLPTIAIEIRRSV